ncbi:Receptor-type tyrosine-protein phosphatase zeta [Habropoda laboriosa]|uniref:protein-tyrosine-phosphatase n=1 Tax=Habropoda laboriosa TaxID=597456 RepID=A0A0L7R068_9HYME|nr:Receptor-type tyrosine-protein phosphatase zeta [Habropoda laboriosa]
MPIDEETEPQEIRSQEQADRLSTADSANGGSKLEEIAYGTSGKSSSTKTMSEDFYRLSRTNGLTTATTKPALEESKFDEKKNKTIHVQRMEDTARLESDKTAKSLEDSVELKEKRGSDVKPEVEVSSDKGNPNASLKLETSNAKNDSTAQKVPEEFEEKRGKMENFNSTKNSEVPYLKEADENKGNDRSISLINDTYVNYSHRYKTSTERDLGASSVNQSRTIESTTDVTFNESAVSSHESRDPKEEVEVVGKVTHPSIQRIIEKQSENSTLKGAQLVKEDGEKSKNENEVLLRNSTKASEIIDAIEQQGRTSEENKQEAILQVTTERTVRVSSSPFPRGRTIAFSGVNEFLNLETKPTTASKLEVSFSQKNLTDKLAEQKPYPYVKSSVKEELGNTSNQVEFTTEDASALENTIGKGQSEEKFIVTEASDVLENSIQQFKPAYYEKVSNESSTVSSTEVRLPVPMTTASLLIQEKSGSTNWTESSAAKEIIGPSSTEEKSTNAGNDVSRWSENRKAITGKGNFDVTGNGITEVSLKPETDDKQTYAASFHDTADKSTALLASSLGTTTAKLTETATALPTTITTIVEETSVENVSEFPGGSDRNGTSEIVGGMGATSSPDESFVPTTTGIEYEFIGLSESAVLLETGRNSTEPPSELPTTDSLSTKNASYEITTISSEVATDNSSTTDETEVINVDGKVASIPVTDQTVVPTSIPSPTTQFNDDEFTSEPNVIETEQISTIDDEIRRMANVSNYWTTTSEAEGTTTTSRTEQTHSSYSKDSHFILNVTESSAEFTSILNPNATDAAPVTTSSIVVPSSLRPKLPISSSTSTPTASDVLTKKTDNKVSPAQEEITPLVRIDMEGSWNDVCLQMDKLKQTLADILTSGMNKTVSVTQIMLQQDPCKESLRSTPSPSDVTLPSILVYVVDENGKFDSTMTKFLPSLYEDLRDRVNFPVTIHRFLLVQETIPDSGNAIAVVVVSSIAFVCLVLLAGLLFIMRKRQTRFNYGERCRPVSLDAYSLDSVSAYNSVRRKGVARSSKRSYGNPTFEDSSAIPSHPLNFAGLSSFYNDVNAIDEEFSGIPQISAKIDELPTGAEIKNRYANVIPLPETRVSLQKINNDILTEYINASYVRGLKNATKYYIACQAPMESTVTDFWRMIWEQQCKVVIMLTDLVENGVEKCTEYIPPSEITDCHRLYGDFQVTLKKRETKEKYAISTLHLKNLESNTFREVYHIWYLWPVNGVQSDGAGLIAVLLEARALQRGGPGPIVVHCSPGTGRTGTLIALDLGIRQYEITRTVDVPRVVYTIRRDRAGAVQTKEQYAFIYKVICIRASFRFFFFFVFSFLLRTWKLYYSRLPYRNSHCMRIFLV